MGQKGITVRGGGGCFSIKRTGRIKIDGVWLADDTSEFQSVPDSWVAIEILRCRYRKHTRTQANARKKTHAQIGNIL